MFAVLRVVFQDELWSPAWHATFFVEVTSSAAFAVSCVHSVGGRHYLLGVPFLLAKVPSLMSDVASCVILGQLSFAVLAASVYGVTIRVILRQE